MEFTRDFLLQDEDYVERCQRHYQMVKAAVGAPVRKKVAAVRTPAEARARIAQTKADRKQRRKAEKRAARRNWPR